jgi:PPM family protein phosphatase
MRAILETAAGNPENQDRGAVIECGSWLVLVVADGAGGLTGGAEAAALAVEFVRQNVHELNDSNSCVNLLQRMDRIIARDKVAGETTCALAVVTDEQVYGASVGDSGVWVIAQSGFIDLTQGQFRKPLAGSGAAWPFQFTHKTTGAERLLLATDGLLKYIPPDRIVATSNNHDAPEAAKRLIELVRYSSGALPDDVTVILASHE